MRLASVFLSDRFITEIWPVYSMTLKRKKTRSDYFSYVCSICDHCRCDFKDVNAVMAQQYFDNLGKGEDALHIKSLHARLSALRSISRFIVTNGLYEDYSNPFFTVDLNPYSNNIHISDIPSAYEISELLQACSEDSQMTLIICFALRCGLSASELCNIRVSDIEEDNNGIYAVTIHSPGKKQSRIVKIPSDVVAKLLDHFSKSVMNEFLFTNSRGDQLKVRTLQNMMKNTVTAAGLSRNITLQELRNSSISYMLAGGAAPEDVSSYVGISNRWMYRFNGVRDEIQSAPCDYNRLTIK